MDTLEDLSGSPPFLTGGNMKELILGSGRRQQGGHQRVPTGPPRPPPPTDRLTGEGTSADPFAQGFDRIMARFDDLEVRIASSDWRVKNLENPQIRDTDPRDEDFDSDEVDYAAHRASNPHHQQLGFRDRYMARRGRRGLYVGRDVVCRDGDWEQEFTPDNRVTSTGREERPVGICHRYVAGEAVINVGRCAGTRRDTETAILMRRMILGMRYRCAPHILMVRTLIIGFLEWNTI